MEEKRRLKIQAIKEDFGEFEKNLTEQEGNHLDQIIRKYLSPAEQKLITDLKDIEITKDSFHPLDEGNSNFNFIAELEDNRQAILKIQNREKSLSKETNVAEIEEAAYLINKILGINLIPLTIARKIEPSLLGLSEDDPIDPEEKAVISLYIDNSETMPESQLELGDEQQTIIAVLDYILKNWDRHDENILINNESEIFAIDNENSFTDTGIKATNSIEEELEILVGKKFPTSLQKAFATFNAEKEDDIRTVLGNVIDENSIDSCVFRIRQMQKLIKETGDDEISEEGVYKLKI